MTDLVYVYDGSFDGLLCCVFESYDKKEVPVSICSDTNTLFLTRAIITDEAKAKRVEKGILTTLGEEFFQIVKNCFLSRTENAEIIALQFIRLGYKSGGSIIKNLGDKTVASAVYLSKSVGREAHRILEFLRFTDNDGNLIAVINPKHFILPIIASHFHERFKSENFFIYDEVHFAALVHMEGRSAIVPVDEFTLPPVTANEEKFRKLWKLFYDTVEIKERRNHKLRMQHMPKRFWKNVTEFCE